jgi:hypothetical protein
VGIDPINAEPATITDFNGFVGLAYLNGTVRQINTTTGEIRTLPFLNTDMRFMKGVFRDTAGQLRHGAFALVWFDVFDPSLGDPPQSQIHDLNPGIQPDGLFWTSSLPSEAIQVNLQKGFASMEATDLPVNDYVTGANAIGGGGPTPQPCTVSFKVVWRGIDERLTIRNDDPVYGGFAGEFIRNTAQMEWTATVGDFHFVSDRLATSSSSFAEVGHERNGVFFP